MSGRRNRPRISKRITEVYREVVPAYQAMVQKILPGFEKFNIHPKALRVLVYEEAVCCKNTTN